MKSCLLRLCNLKNVSCNKRSLLGCVSFKPMLFVPCEQRPFDLPREVDLSTKIEGPLLAGYAVSRATYRSQVQFLLYGTSLVITRPWHTKVI